MTTVGNRDALVPQGSWGLLSLGWDASKAGPHLLCGLIFKSEPTPAHLIHTQSYGRAGAGPVTHNLCHC